MPTPSASPRPPARRARTRPGVAAARATLGEAAFAAAWAAGRTLPLERGGRRGAAWQRPAGRGRRAARPAPAGAFGLTPRELEVLRLLVAGRSNPEIAAALFISPRTATTHVSHIFAKLGVATRAEAVAFAHRHGLA